MSVDRYSFLHFLFNKIAIWARILTGNILDRKSDDKNFSPIRKLLVSRKTEKSKIGKNNSATRKILCGKPNSLHIIKISCNYPATQVHNKRSTTTKALLLLELNFSL